MKMSSPERRRLKSRSVAQHRPQDVDPSSGERDEGLGVPLALGPLALVEGPGVRRAAQAGKSREEEDALEDLVASTHPAVVARPLAGVAGGRDQTGVGGELVGALEGTEISCGHQEFGPEDRTDAGKASEDPSLGTLEKTARYLLIEGGEALLEDEDLPGELRADAGGDLLGGQLDALGFRCGEGFVDQLVGSLNGAPLEVGDQTLMPRPADPGRRLVAGEEDEGALLVEVQGALEGREERQQRLSEAGYGAGSVDDEVASTGEEELQLGQRSLLRSKLGEIRSHTGLVGDDAGVPLVRFGLPG